jgi:hypothetical protein
MVGILEDYQIAGILDACSMRAIHSNNLNGVEFASRKPEHLKRVADRLYEEMGVRLPLLWNERGKQILQVTSIESLSWLSSKVGTNDREREEIITDCIKSWSGALIPIPSYTKTEEGYRVNWMRGWLLGCSGSKKSGCFYYREDKVALRLRFPSRLGSYIEEALSLMGIPYGIEKVGVISIEGIKTLESLQELLGEGYIDDTLGELRTRYTLQEAERLYKDGIDVAEIAKRLHMMRGRLASRLRRRGVSIGKVLRENHFGLTAEEMATAKRLLDEGLSGRAVLRQMNKDQKRSNRLYSLLREAGYDLSNAVGLKRGSLRRSIDFDYIARLHEEGRGLSDIIINDLGLPRGYVGHIISMMRERGYTLHIQCHSSPHYKKRD